MKKLTDVKITKAILNEREELSLNLLIKKGDFTDIEWQLLRKAKTDGDLLDFEIIGFQEAPEDERKKNIQILAIVMSDYCKAFGYNEEQVKNALYKRFKVTSRTLLSDSDLEEAIEGFRVSIISGQA